MKTMNVRSLLGVALLALCAATYADVGSYILYWTADVQSLPTAAATPYYAAIGVTGDGVEAGTYLKNADGSNQAVALTAASGDSAYVGASTLGYVEGSATGFSFYLALLDSSYNVIDGFATDLVSFDRLGTSIMAYDTTSFATPPAAYTFSAGVPEPTSGMLFLLGLAGLALKRKVA